MRLRTKVVASATALVAAAALTSAAPASAELLNKPKKCKSFHFREKMPRWATNMPPGEDVPAGFQANWFDDIYDWTSGTKIGTSVGAMDVISENPDGSDIEYQWELFHFADGTLAGGSSFERNDVISGTWVTQPMEGLTGAYKGYKGLWTWRALFEVPDAPPDFEGKINVCRK